MLFASLVTFLLLFFLALLVDEFDFLVLALVGTECVDKELVLFVRQLVVDAHVLQYLALLLQEFSSGVDSYV